MGDGNVTFDKTWAEYKEGFGEIDGGDYWIGLDAIYELCNEARPCILKVVMTWDGAPYAGYVRKSDSGVYYVTYLNFYLGPESDNYKLLSLEYSGPESNGGNSLIYHKNGAISTKDNDNDNFGGHCSKLYGSSAGWWFKACSD